VNLQKAQTLGQVGRKQTGESYVAGLFHTSKIQRGRISSLKLLLNASQQRLGWLGDSFFLVLFGLGGAFINLCTGIPSRGMVKQTLQRETVKILALTRPP